MTWNIGENRKTIHTMKTIKPAYDREGFAVFWIPYESKGLNVWSDSLENYLNYFVSIGQFGSLLPLVQLCQILHPASLLIWNSAALRNFLECCKMASHRGQIESEKDIIKSQNYIIIEGLGLEGTFKTLPTPLLWAGLPPITSVCPGPHSIWP